jgi:hypothetical protein
MITISVDFIKEELKTDKYLQYIDHYVNLKDKIETFRENQGCQSCIDDVAIPMLKHSFAKWKFALMNNTDTTQINIDLPKEEANKPTKWTQEAEVYRINLQDYDEWVKKLYQPKPHPSPQVKGFNTFYEPAEKIVIVTVVLLKPTQE